MFLNKKNFLLLENVFIFNIFKNTYFTPNSNLNKIYTVLKYYYFFLLLSNLILLI